jgi:hypothetical protein
MKGMRDRRWQREMPANKEMHPLLGWIAIVAMPECEQGAFTL